MSAGLDASVVVRRGTLRLDADLAVRPGETLAVLGPNGAGKTTLLRALAGLTPLAAGRVVLDGRVLDEPGSGRFVPPERRAAGVVFADHLLFPHLSALENVAFGLRSRGAGRGRARAGAREWLDRVGLADRAADRPHALSGGEAQRVALARTLATRPRLLLLDEPLAALDATARQETRRELRRHLAGCDGVRLLVTHDPLDAAALADRVVVLESGRVVQAGTLAELGARPRSRYVADLAGVNLLRGQGHGDRVVLANGFALVVAQRCAGDVLAVVHPRAVTLHARAPGGSPRNVWAGTVEDLAEGPDRVRVRVAGPCPVVAEVTPAAVAELGLAGGVAVWVAVKATEIDVHGA